MPTAHEMQERASSHIDEAVQDQLPGFAADLIVGMMPGVEELLDGGVPEEQVRRMASDHVAQYVGAFDTIAATSAVEEMNRRIDNAVQSRNS